MNILGIIPARGGSKGVPGKNIRLLNGKPLVTYAINAAKGSSLLSAFTVNTDDEAIAAVATQNGITIPFMRPAQLAQDDTPTLPVLQHALRYFEGQGIYYEAVCLLQPTYPFRVPGFIDACIKKFTSTNADTLISVLPVPHQYNPHWVFEKKEGGLLRIATNDKVIIPRRQQLPEAFIRDGNIYITKTNIILQQDSLFGANITYEISDAAWYVNIDTIADWAIAEEKAAAYASTFSQGL